MKNAAAAMRSKSSSGDPVDNDDISWDIRIRNDKPERCPDSGFVFNFATHSGTFSQIRIHCLALDKPFSAAFPEVPIDQVPSPSGTREAGRVRTNGGVLSALRRRGLQDRIAPGS